MSSLTSPSLLKYYYFPIISQKTLNIGFIPAGALTPQQPPSRAVCLASGPVKTVFLCLEEKLLWRNLLPWRRGGIWR